MNLMYGRDNTDTHHTARYHGQLCLAAAGFYFTLAAATIHLASNGRDIATIWPANAVLLSLLLLHKRITWPGILTAGLVANAAANLLTRGIILGPTLYGACNIVEVVVAALVFGRGRACVPILGSARVVGRFVLTCGILAPGISGFFGAATAWYFFEQPFLSALQTWLISDALGLLIFTPVFVAVCNGDMLRCMREKRWTERAETIGLLALTGLVAYLVFFIAHAPLLLVLFAPVMWITFRVGRLERWPGETGQGDKWIFCLTGAMVAARQEQK